MSGAVSTAMPFLQTLGTGQVLLRLYVQPRASREGLAGIHGDALKLMLTVPPVDGRANKKVIDFLAKILGLPKSGILLKRGFQSRRKQVLVSGIDEDEVRRILVRGSGR